MSSKNQTSRTKRRNFELVEETQLLVDPSDTCTTVTSITLVNEDANPDDTNALTADESSAIAKPERSDARREKSVAGHKMFGSYELVWEISKDALSTTYAARTNNIDKLLAVRVFSTRVTDGAQIRSIQKAANKAAELTQLNIVTVYENGIGDNGAPYIVTDWIEGETLADAFQVSKRLDVGRLLDIFNQVSDALIEAHSKLLIHGNLSPTKIILADNELDADCVKVIDFGMPPDPVQNAFYLSPEQRLDSSKADARSDIYALGCMMYEALVGSPPFVGHKVTNASLNCLHELASQYSPSSPEHNALKLLDCIIVKCLQQNPTKRFRSVRELTDALRLVNECICGGNSRKLPPKADKLLLFRFLDFADKKIVAGLFAYILLAGISFNFIGENQLQKYIDEAQLAKRAHQGVAQEYWLAAIQQAKSIGKPPSLLAALHWELADVYSEQLSNSIQDGKFNAGLAFQALNQLESALEYFNHGQRYQAYSLDLLWQMASICSARTSSGADEKLRDDTVKTVRKLFKEKKYKQCADRCAEFLKGRTDNQVAFFAASAFNELAITLPPKEGLRYFQKALYYSRQCDMNQVPQFMNLATCMFSLKCEEDAHRRQAIEALAAGDIEACAAECTFASGETWLPIFEYFEMQKSAREALAPVFNETRLVNSLERMLKIEEKCYGLHADELASTLSGLAIAYARAGQDLKSIEVFERLFQLNVTLITKPEIVAGGYPCGGFTDQFGHAVIESIGPIPRGDTFSCVRSEEPAILIYIDLLAKHGQNKKAIQFMEKILFKNGVYDHSNALFPRLVQAYAVEKETDKATYAASQAIRHFAFTNFATDLNTEN